MVKKVYLLLIFILSTTSTFAQHPDSAYVFAYSVNQGKSGLTLAWSIDQKNWHPIGPEHCFLFSDFGSWGDQKRMFNPYLFQDKNNTWHCLWTLNQGLNEIAHASSNNLFEWSRQNYPLIGITKNIKDIEVSSFNPETYLITWEENGTIYDAKTSDFKTFTKAVETTSTERLMNRKNVIINGQKHRGQIVKTDWQTIEQLIKHEEWMQFHNQERLEKMADDKTRFSDLKDVQLSIKPHPEESKAISDKLIGVFFEDINYAADGGLYAELIQNRDFEYKMSDTKYRDTSWTATKVWSTQGNASIKIDSTSPIHPNNPHFIVLKTETPQDALVNEGWDGIAVTKGENYDFSVFVKNLNSENNKLIINVIDESKRVLGATEITINSKEWEKKSAVLKIKQSTEKASLHITTVKPGTVALDLVSLFPQKTFNNRKNGLRPDLAQTIADLKPKFVRFPGGCVAHGDGIHNIYKWENTIGPLESRVPQGNIWRYHQTAGLGYFEYFQFCEDINAEPLPVVAAGVPCQNSSTGGYGQQCGIPMEDMDAYVQSILNLIEWANGDANSTWGSKRAQTGHPKPFNLKYIGIGNEDLITDVFEDRFRMIYKAVKEAYPNIKVIGTVGPFYMGTDYEEGWKLAKNLNLDMVDEHYYQPPGWFINHQDFYDKYDRKGTKVYLGEYAAHTPRRRMNIESALSEAIYLTSIERNADVVEMTSFAPLLAKEHHTQWNPDLIYFNNTEVKPTVDYYVQQLFSVHSGDHFIPSTKVINSKNEDVTERIGISIVTDSASGDLIFKLVNLLPQAAHTKIDLSAYELKKEAQLIQLYGEPADENVHPINKIISLDSLGDFSLPPYSLSVIRIKSK